jgi:hypothetical protein
MKRLMTVIAALSLALALGACKKDEEKKPEGASGGGSGGDTGVAECDEYIKKYEACFKNMPAAMPAEAKKAMEDGFKANRDAIKSGTSTPEGKTAMKATCKQWVDAIAQNPQCK